MSGLLYVAAGGAIGASCRHLVGMASLRVFGTDYPYGTFIANVFGSFLMGLLAGWLAFKISGGTNIRLFLGVGVLGGFTTFSAFSLDAILMLERKAYGAFASYVMGSVIVSLIALILGLFLSRKIFL